MDERHIAKIAAELGLAAGQVQATAGLIAVAADSSAGSACLNAANISGLAIRDRKSVV